MSKEKRFKFIMYIVMFIITTVLFGLVIVASYQTNNKYNEILNFQSTRDE